MTLRGEVKSVIDGKLVIASLKDGKEIFFPLNGHFREYPLAPGDKLSIEILRTSTRA